MSIFSFHATKVFHTIEGGCICVGSHELYEKIYNLKNFGIRNEELIVEIGANAKMNEFEAAMGLCNLKYIENDIAKRKKVVERYYNRLNQKYMHLNFYNEDLKPNYAYFPVLFADKNKRDQVYFILRKENIFSRKYFYPITADAACFRNKYKGDKLEKARDFSNRILVLPLYADLELKQVDRISEIVNKAVEGEKI
jgi:dTDP-4-amino-4,6-dideoxygalactose transaminase